MEVCLSNADNRTEVNDTEVCHGGLLVVSMWGHRYSFS